jgi:hypothetical protein
MRRQDLIGAWRLLSVEGRSAAGAVHRFAGEDPVGLLIYDPAGYVAMAYMRPGRPKFAAGDPSGGTPEEIAAAFGGFDAYCGSYSVDEAAGVITHRVLASRFPNWEGTDQVRRVELDGDRLRLTTPPIFFHGTEWTVSVTWERARPMQS